MAGYMSYMTDGWQIEDDMDTYAHGGNVDRTIIQYDFSANINPLGLPRGVEQVLRQSTDAFAQYPDPDCRVLREEIAGQEGVDPSLVVCGNGAVEMIYKLLAVKRPRRVLIPAPSFVEYEKAVLECGGQVVYYDMPEPFVLNRDIIHVLRQERVDMVILCSPNNPTGRVIDDGLLQQLMDICIECNVLLLLDACFLGFVRERQERTMPACRQLVVVKAFTKLYAMAGLRLGYICCQDAFLAEEIRRHGPCWNVSVPAQLAGVAALKEAAYVEETRRLIEEEREYLSDRLRSMGLRVYPSQANFILFYCKTPIVEGLRRAGIAIRSCENYRGLSGDYYRIAVRLHEENVILAKALADILGQH